MEVKVLDGEGRTTLPGRSIKRTLQPRYTVHAGTVVRGIADAEPVQIGRRLGSAVKQQQEAAVGSAGVREMAWRERHAEQIGEPLTSSPYGTVGRRPTRTKKISRWEDLRVSDEAIVSTDPKGQHNPLASQGPLDWSAYCRKFRFLALLGPQGCPRWALAKNKPRCYRQMWVPRLTRSGVAKILVEFQFEAVLGKTRRTEF